MNEGENELESGRLNAVRDECIPDEGSFAWWNEQIGFIGFITTAKRYGGLYLLIGNNSAIISRGDALLV